MSVKINVYNQKAEILEEIKLSKDVFGLEANEDLIHQAVVSQESNKRQVLANTKTKAEVRGGGKKPWRQKGTGRARAGSTRSPIWIGGGITFGPRKNRNFTKKINKKMKQKALMMVLSDKVSSDNIVVVDKVDIDEFKTKKFDNFLKKMESIFSAKKDNVKRSFLFVNDVKNEKLLMSSKNLTGFSMINLENLNIIDLLKYKNLLITKSAIQVINDRYSNNK
jgi:large subunit ribosomal protein L4